MECDNNWAVEDWTSQSVHDESFDEHDPFSRLREFIFFLVNLLLYSIIFALADGAQLIAVHVVMP